MTMAYMEMIVKHRPDLDLDFPWAAQRADGKIMHHSKSPKFAQEWIDNHDTDGRQKPLHKVGANG